MGLNFTNKARRIHAVQPDAILLSAKNGDVEAREQLIEMHMPDIIRTASRVSRRYLQVGQDDEVSIALMAFNEAIDSYCDEGGASFSRFAETVIHRRLVDHFRREGKRAEVPLSELDQEDDDGNPYNYAELRGSLVQYELDQADEIRREEIAQYAQMLSTYGIRFSELPKIAPKHRDARIRSMQVARLIAETPSYRQHLIEKQSLPLSMLEKDERVEISRKTMERQRKYIIAIAVLLMSDLYHLKEYITLAL